MIEMHKARSLIFIGDSLLVSPPAEKLRSLKRDGRWYERGTLRRRRQLFPKGVLATIFSLSNDVKGTMDTKSADIERVAHNKMRQSTTFNGVSAAPFVLCFALAPGR